MDARSARIHAMHGLDRAAGQARSLQDELRKRRELILEILSCHDDPRYEYFVNVVAREKIEITATATVPRHADAMHILIADVRQLLAQL